MRRTALTIAALAAACSPRQPQTANVVAPPAASPSPAPSTPDYRGRWTGVEGMFLDVTSGGAPGRYRLTMQYDLDHRGTFAAQQNGAALMFERNGRPLVLRPTDGAATGLRYLAGKRDCLTVAPGEGYCRD